MALETSYVETPPASVDELTGVLRDALGNAQELVRAEVALAKDELRGELNTVKYAALAFGLAVLLFNGALLFVAIALLLAFGESPGLALAIALGFAAIGGILVLLGTKLLSKPHMKRTRSRLVRDAHTLTHATEGEH